VHQQLKYFVYFYYDKNDSLLYIGKAVDVGARWNGHAEPWKSEVCKIGVVSCPDRAAMDVLESYYIAKMPTKYNKAGTQHGHTMLDFPNLPAPKFYSLDQFKREFVIQQGTHEAPPPIVERLHAAGMEILELGPRVNLFDEDLLSKDLDKVCFRYRDFYLVSKYSPIPGRRIKKSEQHLTHRTNQVLRIAKNYFANPNLQIVDISNERSRHILYLPAQEVSELEYELDEIWKIASLYDFHVIKPHGRRENFPSLRCHFHALIHYAETAELKSNNMWVISSEWYKNVPASAFHPVMRRDVFYYDFDEMIKAVEEKYYGTCYLHE
jgi:hypothetical protein